MEFIVFIVRLNDRGKVARVIHAPMPTLQNPMGWPRFYHCSCETVPFPVDSTLPGAMLDWDDNQPGVA